MTLKYKKNIITKYKEFNNNSFKNMTKTMTKNPPKQIKITYIKKSKNYPYYYFYPVLINLKTNFK